MKSTTVLILFIYSIFVQSIIGQTSSSGTSDNFTTDSKPPNVSLIEPNGGEFFYFGDSLLTVWNATDNSFGPSPISILISTDAGNNYDTLVSEIVNEDSAYINPPHVVSNSAKIKIFAQDEFGLTAYDESDAFFYLKGIYVNLKVFLEGPYTGNNMLAYLNFFGYIPLSQPYFNPPWNYFGYESTPLIPNNDVIDWVLIELRDASEASSATESTIVSRQAAFILENGNIVSTDGSSMLEFNITYDQNLYAVVWHRNHLGIMSAYPLSRNGLVFSYDYTVSEDKAYGGGHKLIGVNTWGMNSGDGNSDGQVNNIDKDDIWYQQFGSTGYLQSDFNMDGQNQSSDINGLWDNNSGVGSLVPE